MTDIPREHWQRALMTLPEKRLSETVDAVLSQFPSSWKITPKSVPQSGLGMLKLRESTQGEDFYLGEFPLATCWLAIQSDQGSTQISAEGAALIMDDQIQWAENMALCDAVLAHQLPGWEQVAELLQQGEANRQQIEHQRKTLLARTQVDFSLLDQAGDDDA